MLTHGRERCSATNRYMKGEVSATNCYMGGKGEVQAAVTWE